MKPTMGLRPLKRLVEMPTPSRRDLLCALPLLGAVACRDSISAQSIEATHDVSRTLARYVVQARAEGLPANVSKEATRTLLNFVGCALGGCRHDAVNTSIAALAPLSTGQSRLIGRRERLDVFHAALVNGISSHVLDFDDTHLKTVIHPGGPVIPALFVLAERQPISGRDFLHALVLGVEVECRIGNSVYPAHYDAGWHISGTAGVFGAAAAAGKVLGLSEQQMTWALGIAAAQPVGLRSMFGTMTKSFHVGRAAQNGLTAALLAKQNFTSSEQALEAKSGWANVLSSSRNYSEITTKLGSSYEILLNTYKPYACGIVIHPVIDGCIQLRNQHKLTAPSIERIELEVHPLVLELTGKKTPKTGLDGKFSVFFAAALAIVEGKAGEREFTDVMARNPEIVTLRDRVSAKINSAIHEDQARIAITLKDGRRLETFVEHAKGSVGKPMSDAELDAKFESLAEGVVSSAQAKRIMQLCWQLQRLPDAAEVIKEATA